MIETMAWGNDGVKVTEGNFYVVGKTSPSSIYTFVKIDAGDILFIKHLCKEETIVYNLTKNIEYNETKNFHAWNSGYFKNLKLLEDLL